MREKLKLDPAVIEELNEFLLDPDNPLRAMARLYQGRRCPGNGAPAVAPPRSRGPGSPRQAVAR